MKNILILLLLSSTFFACRDQAKEVIAEAETTIETVEEKVMENDSDWTTLFDGSSFDNWRGYLSEEMHPEWTLEDGAFPEAYETGAEIQVLDNERHPDAKVAGGTHTAGSLYDMIAPPSDVTKPAGGWNLCVLEVNHKTNQGKVTLNGTELFTFPVHGADWDNMVENSKFKGWKGFGKFQTGHIGLQDHSDKVWYRNIKIKNLD